VSSVREGVDVDAGEMLLAEGGVDRRHHNAACGENHPKAWQMTLFAIGHAAVGDLDPGTGAR
jgi:hypothetical protein